VASLVQPLLEAGGVELVRDVAHHDSSAAVDALEDVLKDDSLGLAIDIRGSGVAKALEIDVVMNAGSRDVAGVVATVRGAAVFRSDLATRARFESEGSATISETVASVDRLTG